MYGPGHFMAERTGLCMVQAFIFDLDGTLLDSEVLWVEALQAAFRMKGCDIADATARELVFGKAWLDIFRDANRDYPGVYPDIRELEPITTRIFAQLRQTRDIRIQPSIDLLIRLGSAFPLAIVSGSTRATIAESIEFMDVGACVRFFLGTEDYPAGKPDPTCFLMAAERFGLPPAACLVFEDSAAGVRAAKAAGMTCVALRREHSPVQEVSAADEVLTDLGEFQLGKYRQS